MDSSKFFAGFAYKQGIQENVLAAVRGAGALVGISGSFAFPRLRPCLGLPRTGILGLLSQLTFLSLTIASIWLPGSPFDLGYLTRNGTDPVEYNVTSCKGQTTVEGVPQVSIWVFLAGVTFARFGEFVCKFCGKTGGY